MHEEVHGDRAVAATAGADANAIGPDAADGAAIDARAEEATRVGCARCSSLQSKLILGNTGGDRTC
jgi:hypothetical protein